MLHIAVLASPAAMFGAAAALQFSLPTEARWLVSDADSVMLLTTSPGECLTEPEGENEAYLIEIGRTAFKSPLLFGGQAARSGLSCNSCHIDGRDNPAFFLEGLSSAPGTADVTSSLFSESREDGVFNPAPIPTLVGSGEKDIFGSMKPASSLHAFIEGAVTDEFNGSPPPQAVINGLAAYISRLDPAACPEAPTEQTPRQAMENAVRAIGAARAAHKRNDAATADFMIVSARQALGRVNERFPGGDNRRARAALEDLSRKLEALRDETGVTKSARLGDLEIATRRLGVKLQKQNRRSLYNPDRLRQLLAESQR